MKNNKVIILSSIAIVLICTCAVLAFYLYKMDDLESHKMKQDVATSGNVKEGSKSEAVEAQDKAGNQKTDDTSNITYDEVLSAFSTAIDACFWFWSLDTTFSDEQLEYVDQYYSSKREGSFLKATYKNMSNIKEIQEYMTRFFSEEMAEEICTSSYQTCGELCIYFVTHKDNVYVNPPYMGECECYDSVQKVSIRKINDEFYQLSMIPIGERKKEYFTYEKVGDDWLFTQFDHDFFPSFTWDRRHGRTAEFEAEIVE